jgi:hypothetical protein
MCGICGNVVFSSLTSLEAAHLRVKAMLRSLSHRGPDATSQVDTDLAVFGATRLAIRGLTDQFNQPMVDAASGVIVVCNGDIDNHRELRRWLAERSRPVQQETDVAVIPGLYLGINPYRVPLAGITVATAILLGLGATTIGALVSAIIPEGSIFLAVLLYALGMVAFTMIMGNAFAAFPVMAAAIGVPILIQADASNPAVIGAVGMLSGFCGTLMTPMAANFNIVPAALLELKNQYGVIKVQVPTALAMLAVNIAILYVAGFRL